MSPRVMRTDTIKAYSRIAASWAIDARNHAGGRAREIRRLRRRAHATPRHLPGQLELEGFRIQYVDLMSVFMEYKDIFGQEIYGFEASGPQPRVIDGGGYIGMSVLYFKLRYPGARVTCFEPDAEIFRLLERNIHDNELEDVELV